jgi:hypothetical protein
MKLSANLGLIFIVLRGATAFAAQELLQNGDFETGSLAPWTVASGSAAIVPNALAHDGGAVNCQLTATAVNFTPGTASITQTVATNAGSRYLVRGSAQNGGSNAVTITATPSGGGAALATFGFDFTVQDNGAVFTATSASTVITASSSSFAGTSHLNVDNISLMEIPASSPLAGKYTGVATSTVANETAKLSQKSTQAITARIGTDSGIVILQGGQFLHGGVVLDNGAYSIRAGGQPAGLGQGTAVIQGKTIRFTVPGFSLGQGFFTDHLGNVLGAASLTFKLTRVGP